MAKLRIGGPKGVSLDEEKKSEPFKPHPAYKPSQDRAFDRLFGCSWRGIPFPVSSIRINLSHDLAEHKYWGKDGASVEATGRAPLVIDATIPFVNGIAPGKNERWGLLYPTTFLQFLEAFNDKTTGILDTPEIAGLTCKPHSLDFAYEGQRQDGVEVTAKWVETVEEELGSDVRIAPMQAAQASALNLDADKTELERIAGPVKVDSFESFMHELTGLIDTPVSKLVLLMNKPKQIYYHVDRLQEHAQSARSALTWQAEDQCERFKEALRDIEQFPERARQALRKVGRYRTTSRMSLSGFQAMFPNNSVDDVIHLNPRLASQPMVAANTVLRYYK